jgi:chorismate-pyruvate lyase
VSLDRRPFPADAAHAPLLRLLLAQDGSTTRICEALTGAAVQVVLHHQAATRDVPAAVRDQLGGNAWLERVTSLCADDAVMMDNLSYTRLDAVPKWFLAELERGAAPIGHLLDQLFVKRESVEAPPELRARLWNVVGEIDERASRSYRIVTPDGPLMLIFESFRAAMVRHA